MSIGAIVTLVVLAVLVIAAIGYVMRRRQGAGGSLKRRFGPEYDRTLNRHNGDTQATERELKERVERHGHLEPKPLAPGAREQYLALWAGVQERFVESPQQAAAEADQLLGRLARERGFPDSAQHDEQVAALSVHHGRHVDAYRRIHAGAAGQAGTEDLRHAMLEARELFEELAGADATHHGRSHDGDARHDGGRRTGRAHAPWALHKKGEAR